MIADPSTSLRTGHKPCQAALFLIVLYYENVISFSILKEGRAENDLSRLDPIPLLIWMDYDEEADVLYVNFDRPQAATDSEILEDDIVVRYRDDEVIGLTILHTKSRMH